jgi:DNA polymerase elongation subunit (family B)
MLSLRLKNYALLGYDDRLTLKGSALRNRREEPFIRRLIQELCLSYLDPEQQPEPRERYLHYVGEVLTRRLIPEDIARTETVTDASRNTDLGRRLAAAVGNARVGERVAIYQREGGSLAPIESFAGDEDRAYLLRRLRDAAERFRVLYDSEHAFDYDFPLVSLTTDLEELRASAPVSQPRLF